MPDSLGPAPTDLDWTAADALSREAGGAFYRLDIDRLRGNHAALMDAFGARYAASVFAYSVKTNYTPRILQEVRALDGTAEVVSEMEYRIARRVGFPPTRIIVNGPLHGAAFLREAVADGAMVNLDGWYALDALDAAMAADARLHPRVGLRLNTPLPGVDWSRFGFATDDEGMRALAEWFQARPRCALVGLHSHFPLAPPTLAAFRARIDALIAAARVWFPEAPLAAIDIGGGFRKPPEGPAYADLADTLADALEQAFPAARRPALVIEPGTAIVADAIDFVCRVHDVKRAGRRTLAQTDGSVHAINTMMWRRDFDVRVLHRPDATADGPARFDVAGNTCMERKDIVCRDVPGPVARGDMLLFRGVGSYAMTLKPPFIHPCPPVLAYEGGRHSVVKRRETVDDVLATYEL